MARLPVAVFLVAIASSVEPTVGHAQVDSLTGRQRDSSTVQSSAYRRPFIGQIASASVGGYAEGNANYFSDNGVREGWSSEFRRFNIFLFAPIGRRMRFLSELEFEHGTEEISLEAAQVDVQLTRSLSARMGVLVLPIGAFNQSHDGPRWEFVDRPLVSTRVIPTTLSEVGGGVFGRVPVGRRAQLTFDLYATNGLQDGVVLNDEGRTSLRAGRAKEQFEADNNGSPALSGRLAANGRFGEVGTSFYSAIYNRFRIEGQRVDDARRVTIVALDWTTSFGPVAIRGEAAQARIDLPPGHEELLGQRQWGAHIDFVIPVLVLRRVGADARMNVALRVEYVDLNVGTFRSTGLPTGDEVAAFVPGISVRATSESVFRLNWRFERSRDLPRNPAARRGGLQLGFATYF